MKTTLRQYALDTIDRPRFAKMWLDPSLRVRDVACDLGYSDEIVRFLSFSLGLGPKPSAWNTQNRVKTNPKIVVEDKGVARECRGQEKPFTKCGVKYCVNLTNDRTFDGERIACGKNVFRGSYCKGCASMLYTMQVTNNFLPVDGWRKLKGV